MISAADLAGNGRKIPLVLVNGNTGHDFGQKSEEENE
jgi:hypothetical protein